MKQKQESWFFYFFLPFFCQKINKNPFSWFPNVDPGHKWKKMFYPPWIITPIHREPKEPIVLIWKWIFLSTRSIHFLTFLILTETLHFFFRMVIWTFTIEICFRNQFFTLGTGHTENMQIRVFVYFQFDHLPKLKIDS